MAACPQCSKPLRELARRCPSCQADLDLLVDFVSHLQGGIQRAENLTRAGELGDAVWAYLEVLETEPDNAPARRQISRVVTAVRQFDLSTPARRIASGMPLPDGRPWYMKLPLGPIALTLGGLFVGMFLGVAMTRPPAPPRPPGEDLLPTKNNEAMGAAAERLAPPKPGKLSDFMGPPPPPVAAPPMAPTPNRRGG
jgi:hypothetical protein